MSVIEIERVITPYGDLEVYVVATAGTHHSTIASAVLKYTKTLAQPAYVESTTGVTRAGKWCVPTYSGEWKQLSTRAADTHIRKTFRAWAIPA